MKTRLLPRTFLLCFLPFALLLACSFWTIQRSVKSTVRTGLHASLRESQLAIANVHARGDLQNSRFLKVAGENSALKAGMELLSGNPYSAAARRTVEDQLRELGEHMGFDLMLVAAPNGTPLAGVSRQSATGESHSQLVPLHVTDVGQGTLAFLPLNGRTFQLASVPIDVDDENIGVLTIGEFFDFSGLATPAVLLHDGKVLNSNLPQASFADLERALSACPQRLECNFRIGDASWIAMPIQVYRDNYVLLSLQNVDAATKPILSRLQHLFLTLAAVSVLIALLCSFGCSNSIVKPIAAVVTHLHNAVNTGQLSELEPQSSSIQEIQELADFYNRASRSLRVAGENLQAAYLEFVGSLASALDARDQYTAGHSHRVSQLSCAVASALDLPAADLERIRIGALLHDIGKIGIADSILQKPGRLSAEEFALVRQHPVIGRRILEQVQGFAPFLGAVELHHENWDGSGYPLGQKTEETPIDARIIHVCDAYDAMTTDRAYRRGTTHEQALAILLDNAGRQFDPSIVGVFVALPREILAGQAGLGQPAMEQEAVAG